MKNLAYFLAKRIQYQQSQDGKSVSPPAIRIAVWGIAVGLAIMILSVAIVIGFKKEIRQKVIGFGSHIQISNFNSNATYETQPIAFSDSLIHELSTEPGVMQLSRVATKPAVIKTDSAFLAVVLKGVGPEYHWDFFAKNLKEGDTLKLSNTKRSNDVMISQEMADKLQLSLGDSFVSYFIQDGVRARKFNIAGIYQTNFTDYDKLFVMADIGHVQRLNGWNKDQVSGLELMVDDYDHLDAITDELYFLLDGKRDQYDNPFYVRSIKELNPQIFSWLDLLDLNVWVILILMSLVATFTMISGLLIIILERTSMIGLLKSLGYNNWGIRKVFLYVALFLVLKGMLWGNIIGIGLCAIQKYFGVVSLDPHSYYLDRVPVELNVIYILLLNIATILISFLVLVGPSYIVTKITPSKSMKFE